MKGSIAPTGIALALAVLEEVARTGPTLTANGIARALAIPRTSVYRVINSLVSEEYLLRHPTLDGFVLGVRVIELASLIPTAPYARVPDIIDELRADVGEAIHFVRYTRGRVVVVDEDPLLPMLSIDRTRRQLASTAIGRLLLASFPPRSSTVDLAALDTVVQTARSSGITWNEHRLIIEEVSKAGFARHVDTDAGGRTCVAVPVLSPAGALVAGVALSLPGGDMARALQHVDRLRAAAEELARASDEDAPAAARV